MSMEMTQDSLVGETISQYRVLRQIGRGGMATVYEAEDTLLGRHVALKVIAESLLRDAEAVALFEREARAAAALDHPNICTVYELTQYKGRPVIVMELLEGESLREAVRRGPLPIALVIDIGIEIADALDAAHAKGFVHRDIKPGNIMCNDRGQAKLLDFGLAKSGNREGLEEEIDANNGSIGGTVQFMSPEQTHGEPLDARSDLFSFGIVLYEMTTGQRPFQRRSGLATMEAIRTIHPASPRSLNPEVPEGLELIIAKLLEKDPANRYQSAADLRSDLEYLKLSLQAAESERGQAVSDNGEWNSPHRRGGTACGFGKRRTARHARLASARLVHRAVCDRGDPVSGPGGDSSLPTAFRRFAHEERSAIQCANRTRTPHIAAAPSATTNTTLMHRPGRLLLLQPWSTATTQTRNRMIASMPRPFSHICRSSLQTSVDAFVTNRKDAGHAFA